MIQGQLPRKGVTLKIMPVVHRTKRGNVVTLCPFSGPHICFTNPLVVMIALGWAINMTFGEFT